VKECRKGSMELGMYLRSSNAGRGAPMGFGESLSHRWSTAMWCQAALSNIVTLLGLDTVLGS